MPGVCTGQRRTAMSPRRVSSSRIERTKRPYYSICRLCSFPATVRTYRPTQRTYSLSAARSTPFQMKPIQARNTSRNVRSSGSAGEDGPRCHYLRIQLIYLQFHDLILIEAIPVSVVAAHS